MINDILNGWGNSMRDSFGLLNPITKAISEERLKKCDTCYLRIDNRCNANKEDFAEVNFMYKGEFRQKGKLYKGCGCNIVLKSKCTNEQCKCPIGRWNV